MRMTGLMYMFLLTLISAATAQPIAPGDDSISVDHANRVGIIVELSSDFIPEGKLFNHSTVAAQRAAIDYAQTVLLDRLKGRLLTLAESDRSQRVAAE